MEKRTHFNETPGVSGEMSMACDLTTGRVQVFGTGFWSVAQCRAFFGEWTILVHRVHAAGLSVAVLCDMSGSAVQKSDVAEIVATATTGLYADGDSIAMIVPNSLTKMQMRRVLDLRFHDFFLSRHAAETWLQGRAIAAARHRTAIGHAA